MAQNNFTWPLINDNITQRDREVLADFCLNGKRFTNGEKVKEFEKDFLEFLNAKHRDTLDALKAGKLDDNITDVIEKVAKEVSAKYN